jgi:hypothetical protein
VPEELAGSRLVDLVGEEALGLIAPFWARVLAGESVQAELDVP